MTLSILDEVPGVGPARKKALKKRFGSMKRLCAATVEELAQTPGVSEQVAQNVYDTLAAWQKEREDVADA
jgi:excinuclease ABC subunit C